MALHAFKSQLSLLAPLTVTVRSDNTTTVHLINKRRAAITLLRPLRRLFIVCHRLSVHLQAVYLPGVENQTADRLSRLAEPTGYSLRAETLERLLTDFQFLPTLDVFGRESELWSLPIMRSVSRAAEQRVNSGPSQPWRGHHLFLHPPLNKILSVLQRLQAEPTPAVLITPAWLSQPWSPILLSLAERQLHLGSFDTTMTVTAEFRRAGWRLPPGGVVATLLATRTTPVRNF
jgi:hypothetical protein